MKTYKLSPVFFTALNRRLLAVMIPICILAIGIVVVNTYLNTQNTGINMGPIVIVVAMLIVAVVGYSMWRAIRQQRMVWSSYRLTLSEHAITREQDGFSPISITRSGLAKVMENPGGALILQATNRSTQIIIPADLESFSEVRACLAEWHPIESLNPRKMRLNILVVVIASLGFLAAWFVAVATPNQYLAIGLGLACLFVYIAYMVYMWRSPQVGRDLKRGLLWTIFPMIALILRIITAIAGVM